MRRLVLSGPRDVVVSFDDAFVAAYRDPGMPPRRDDYQDADAFARAEAEHAAATERWARWKRYLETYDVEVLRPDVRPGEEPTIFKVASLTADQQAHVNDFAGRRGQFLKELLAYGVHDVLNFYDVDPRGNVAPFRPKREPSLVGLRLSDESLEIFNNVALMEEVVQQIILANNLLKRVAKSA